MEKNSLFDMKLLREGDLTVYKKFFTFYYPKLMGFACRFVDRFTAEDIVQEVFLYVWENREMMQITRPLSFLFKNVQNKCLNHLKHKMVIESYEAEVRIAKNRLLYIMESTDGNAVYAQVIKQDVSAILRQAIEKLSPKCARACYLYYFRDYSVKEIAQILNVSPRTVEGYIYQALITLRKELKDILLTIFLLYSIL